MDPRDLADAHQVFADLAAADIEHDDVTETLERDGVKKFVDSFANSLRTSKPNAIDSHEQYVSGGYPSRYGDSETTVPV